jgi:uncharacterized membrane protein HdeD (DUF308 family)
VELSIKDILKINSTIIAGVFILLSLIFSGDRPFELSANLALFIYLIGSTFSLSSIIAIFVEIFANERLKKALYTISKILMIIGFVILFIGFVATLSYVANLDR